MDNNEQSKQKTAENLYSTIKIDGKNFKTIDELSADYQRQIQQIKKDSIEKSTYFLCK